LGRPVRYCRSNLDNISTYVQPYRLGFAVKVLGEGGLKGSDTRRWQSRPHLSRSLELLDGVFDYLGRNDLRVYRLSSSTVPYGTHPDLPELDYRRQIDACGAALEQLGAKARALGLRLSTHPGQYTVLNAPDEELARKAKLDLEQDALLLDALGQGPDAVVVVHVGGLYGDKGAALERWAAAYETLSERARERLVVEHDELLFHLGDALELHRRTGVRVVFDHHHHRCYPAPGLEELAAALAVTTATWPRGVRPKVHLSSSRTELRLIERKRRGSRGKTLTLQPPRLEQHADFVTPWDLVELLEGATVPLDVMLEAKAKDLAVLWLRRQLDRRYADVGAGEERSFGVCDKKLDRNGHTDVEARDAPVRKPRTAGRGRPRALR